jgi:micrococcal nuclease
MTRLALGVLLGVAVSAHAFTVAAFQAKVVGVADGDTLTVLRDKTTYRVRLHGIDAPEGGQAYGRRAKETLRIWPSGSSSPSSPSTATSMVVWSPT